MTFQWKFKYKLRFVKLVFLVEFSNFTFVTHWAVTTTQSQIFKWKWMPLQFFLQGFSVWHSIWQEASSLCLPLKGLGVGWKQEKGGAWEGRTEWASERMKEDLFQSLGGISLTTQSKKEKKKIPSLLWKTIYCLPQRLCFGIQIKTAMEAKNSSLSPIPPKQTPLFYKKYCHKAKYNNIMTMTGEDIKWLRVNAKHYSQNKRHNGKNVVRIG